MEKGKVIIFSAPSGCGKSTIIGRLMPMSELRLKFSVSATTRAPRGEEVNGREYYFMSEEEFRQKIADGCFVEFEEVYPGRFYGTLRSEIDRITTSGDNVVLDIDVEGGVNMKNIFGKDALSIFIMPPSVEELERRLIARGTDTPESIAARVGKAGKELEYAPRFDAVVVNENLEEAVSAAESLVKDFTK